MFIISVIWAVVYVVVYDIVKLAPYQEEEYKNEMAAAGIPAQSQAAAAFDTNIVALTDQASLDAGKDIWIKQCKVCHLEGGQGLVGPNLADNFSIHGCDYKDVVKIIVVGAPEKGMISWKTMLTDDQIKQVASYTMTIMGTNPPNPKEPQGEPCK
jgi:cytochrome c oxidase cbb3-type subunit 3